MLHPEKAWDGLRLQDSALVDRIELSVSLNNKTLHIISHRNALNI